MARRSPAENLQLGPRTDAWSEASFDPKEGVKADKRKRNLLVPLPRIDTVVAKPEIPMANREEVGNLDERATPILENELTWPKRAVASPRTGGVLTSHEYQPDRGSAKPSQTNSNEGDSPRNAEIENSPRGPTELYSGSLWRRGLQHDVVP